jgi:Pyridine nucleotide-disulphide oxidoreductase
VVVAAASYQKPRLPAFARDAGTDIFQMHSHEYRKPDQIPDGPVLVIGAGNSGAEIALELARTHKVYLSGRDVGHIPFDIEGFLGRNLLVRLVIRGLFHRVLTIRTPMGRKFRSKMHGHGLPLIRIRPGQLARAGVRRIGKVAHIVEGKAASENGEQSPSTVSSGARASTRVSTGSTCPRSMNTARRATGSGNPPRWTASICRASLSVRRILDDRLRRRARRPTRCALASRRRPTSQCTMKLRSAGLYAQQRVKRERDNCRSRNKRPAHSFEHKAPPPS